MHCKYILWDFFLQLRTVSLSIYIYMKNDPFTPQSKRVCVYVYVDVTLWTIMNDSWVFLIPSRHVFSLEFSFVRIIHWWRSSRCLWPNNIYIVWAQMWKWQIDIVCLHSFLCWIYKLTQHTNAFIYIYNNEMLVWIALLNTIHASTWILCDFVADRQLSVWCRPKCFSGSTASVHSNHACANGNMNLEIIKILKCSKQYFIIIFIHIEIHVYIYMRNKNRNKGF